MIAVQILNNTTSFLRNMLSCPQALILISCLHLAFVYLFIPMPTRIVFYLDDMCSIDTQSQSSVLMSNPFFLVQKGKLHLLESHDFLELRKLCLPEENYDMCMNVVYTDLGISFFIPPKDKYMYIFHLQEYVPTKYLLTPDLTPVDDFSLFDSSFNSYF